MKILIVDDNAESRYMLEYTLRADGYETESASNGIEALEKLKNDSFDAVISDIMMPKMDGFRLIQECRNDASLNKIPFIFYTATYTEKKDIDFGLSLGAVRYIIKPTEPDEFLSILNEILKNIPREAPPGSAMPAMKETVFQEEYSRRLINSMDKKIRELTESEERFRTFAGNLPGIVYRQYIRDDGNRMEFFNDQLMVLTGYTPDELTAGEICSIEPFILPGDRTRVVATVNESILNKVPFEVEYRFRHKSGKIVAFLERGRPATNTDGVVTSIDGVIFDITDKKETEEALRKSQAHYKQLVENINDVIFTIDLAGIITYISPVIYRLYGYTPDEVIDKHFSGFVHPDDLPSVAVAFNRRVEGDYRENVFRIRARDGSERYVSTKQTPIITDGEITGFNYIMADITQRTRAEEAVRESEEKYRSLFEHMLNGSAYCRMLYDDQGQPVDFVYLNVNRAFEELTGLKDVEGKKVTAVIPKIRELNPELFEIYGRVALTGTPESFELDFRPLNCWFHVSAFSPEKDHFVAVFEDITERKQSDEALRQANKKLNLLSSITRHDILNGVAVLMGYIDLASEEVQSPGMKEYIGHMEKAAKTIRHQIEFTKEYQEIGVSAATWQNIRDTVQKTGSVFKMDNVTLTINCGNSEIYADPLLQKVFYNLFDNAFRHAPPFTSITVRCDETEGGMSVVFEDNGAGIPEDARKHLFEHGFGENTGLGLFLSREILAITGITIMENGETGKGARFEMTVPRGKFRLSGAEKKTGV